MQAADLMKGIKPEKVENRRLSEEFINSTADFSFELFREALKEGENCMVSPLSVYLALGMTANGAGGETLDEFAALLGRYGLTMDELNEYYYSLCRKLTDGKRKALNIANSIWYADYPGLKVKGDFLRKNADYYGAAAYKADFASMQAVKDINNWVKDKTRGMIDKIVDDIDDDAIMFLINAVAFEAEWEKKYKKSDVRDEKFYLSDGKSVDAEFMYSNEKIFISFERVIEKIAITCRDGEQSEGDAEPSLCKKISAKGFVKPYKGGKFSFVALLPEEGRSPEELANYLSGNEFVDILKNKSNGMIKVALPKFESEYEVGLIDPLKDMGLERCFDRDKADFSNMAEFNGGNIYVGDVIHKTYISVDERGTKAAAATGVEMLPTSVPEELRFDRPFVYAIVDNDTCLPLFLGIVNNPAGN